MNILAKSQAMEAVEQNKKRFEEARKSIIKTNSERDKRYLLEHVAPAVKKRLAVSHFAKHVDSISFATPFMDMEGHRLTEEEKQAIIDEYYFQETTIGESEHHRGRICKRGIVGGIIEEALLIPVGFEKCEIDKEKNEVFFQLYLNNAVKSRKKGIQEEIAGIVAKLDAIVAPYVAFEKLAEKINQTHALLSGDKTVAVRENDLMSCPLLKVDLDEIVGEAFFEEIGLQKGDGKFQFGTYLQAANAFDEAKRDLEKHGYSLYVEGLDDEKETFRDKGFQLTMSVMPSRKKRAKANAKIAPAEETQAAFDAQMEKYRALTDSRSREENVNLVKMVEEGAHSDCIAEKLMQNILMQPRPVAETLYGKWPKRMFENVIWLRFKMPFNREFENLVQFKRLYHNSKCVGHRYMNLENNAVEALRKKYPFLEKAVFSGDDFYDYKHKTGVYGREGFAVEENTIAFSLGLEPEGALQRKEAILGFLASRYGTLDAEGWMAEAGLTEEGVSEKINRHIAEQSAGKAPKQNDFHIVLAEASGDKALELYQNSELSAKIEKLVSAPFEKEFMEEQGEALAKKNEGRISLRLANLFCMSLIANKNFQKLADELKKYDYQLKIRVEKEVEENMVVDRWGYNGEPVYRDVASKYKTQITIE